MKSIDVGSLSYTYGPIETFESCKVNKVAISVHQRAKGTTGLFIGREVFLLDKATYPVTSWRDNPDIRAAANRIASIYAEATITNPSVEDHNAYWFKSSLQGNFTEILNDYVSQHSEIWPVYVLPSKRQCFEKSSLALPTEETSEVLTENPSGKGSPSTNLDIVTTPIQESELQKD